LHIPFPSFELFRLLPWRRELLKGMLGADLIGFHTYDYVQHFLNSVRRIVGYEHTFGKISAGRRLVKADVFPMGIDYGRFARTVDSGPVKREVTRVRNRVGDKKIILSVDRLDYTKGIPRRLKMFEQFLKENPRYREQVVLILLAVPSRTAVERYKALKREVDGLVGNINGSRGTLGWNPIWYLYRSLPFTSLLALYRAADIALVTPVRDGMNLVAKEFLAAKPDETGCLVLSEMAGAAKELGEALIVNPNNQEEVIGALVQALEMGEEEQRARNVIMQKRIQRYNGVKWAIDFVYNLSDIKEDQEEYLARKLTGLSRTTLIDNYRKGERRLILLDYDGTLVRFSKQPQNVAPDGELLAVLETLSRNKKNRVVVVSGRDRQVLENWLGNLEIGLVAEHGAWIRDEGESWRTIKPMQNEWKKDLRPTLELYTDRTPGSFIEEKDFSLVWHYRQVDPEFAYVRARELKDDLLHITANMNLGVLEGNKVIEIRGQGIDKGQAGMYWIDQDWDFLMAVGDDQTDEDLFEVVPDSAYSLKVGLGSSKARFNLSSVDEVRGLIMDLARENNEKNA
ncbi:MAG: bifunctional alpha,alpha-trehalose-phosphate synthase (UDP-forming)/trehalose-phosphatase, partial [Terriglobia bacterium]